MRLIDTNVLVRLIAQDHAEMLVAAAALFEAVERQEEEVLLPDTVVAEVIYVLSSRKLYGMSRADVSRRLGQVLSLPNVIVENKTRCLGALELWFEHRWLSFVDAYTAIATREQTPAEVYSFDRDFDRVEGVRRVEPVVP